MPVSLLDSFKPNLSARGKVPTASYGTLPDRSSSARAEVFPGASPETVAAVAAADADSSRARGQVADLGGQIVPADDGGYRLNFDNADIAAVTKAILGDILKVNYLVDKRVTGQVTLTSSRPVPRTRLLPLLESALSSVGASVVKDHDLYRVVPSADPGGIGAVNLHGTGEGYGVSVITAKYMSAAALGHLLEGFGSRAGSIKADPAANLVLVQGTASEREAAIEAADAVDVDWLRAKSVAILPVANSAPETVIAEINHILDTGEGGLGQSAVQLEPMSRINAILAVSRRPEGVAFVRKWVTRLDRTDAMASGIKVYHLQYAQAKAVAAAINDLFGNASESGDSGSDKGLLEPSSRGGSQTGTSPSGGAAPGGSGIVQAGFSSSSSSGSNGSGSASGGDAGGGGGAQAGAAQSPFGALRAAINADAAKRSGAGGDGLGGGPASGLRITADPNTNSLLIKASGPEYRIVERAIRQMDRAPTEIAIEATIAEVTLSQELQYGVQFFLQSGKFSLGLSGATGVPLQTMSSEGLNILAGSAANPKLLLDALQSFTTVKILSSPSLVVVDRQPATLEVGDQVPILTRTAQSVDTSTTAPVVNNVDYKDTGIILNVLPRVNANGMVSLDVEQQVSAVTSTDPTSLTPTISQRRVRSTVSVANGQTVMLAGLISDKQSQSRSGIPGLSSISFLKDILTSHDNALNRTEIIIFIRPEIITSPTDAQDVTEEFHNRLLSMRHDIRPAVTSKD